MPQKISAARQRSARFSLAVISSNVILSSLVVGLTPFTALAVGETCNGLAATIVSDAATINGTNGNDVIVAGPGNNTINGGLGQDTICGGEGNDIMNGGTAEDTLFGEGGDDQLNGDAGSDELHGGDGNDTLSGGANADQLFGDDGYDTLNGNLGNDNLNGGADADVCNDLLGSNTMTACEASGLQGVIVIKEDSEPNHAQDFDYTGFANFTLDNDADNTNSDTYSEVKSTGLGGTSYSVIQSPTPSEWSLANITCVDPSGGTASNVGSSTATIDLDANEVVVCTFTNESPDADSDGVIDNDDNCVDVANPGQETNVNNDPDGYGDACSSATTETVLYSDLDNTSSTPAIVAADGLDKWFFYNDENDTVDNTLGNMVFGPFSPADGNGSAQISATGTQRRNLATYQFENVLLSDIKAMSFKTLSQSVGNGSGPDAAPFLTFNVDFDGSDTWQRRLVFVPSENGSVTADTWQTWDAIDGGSAMWSYSGANWPAPLAGPNIGVTGVSGTTEKSWDQILIDYPAAKTRTTDSLLGLRVGEPYPSGFTGNIDSFTFKVKGDETTFDFDVDVEACNGSAFDSFTYGSVNGQGGWGVTGPYDQAIEPNIYGYPTLGCKTFRLSNAVTAGSFGDQVFSFSNANEAGETVATANGFSGGTRQNHLEAQFDIASAQPGTQQTGLNLSVSPDRGDGSRMSYLRFDDNAGGIDVTFYDVSGTTSPVSFNPEVIATGLDRTAPHTIKFVMDFIEGPSNDVVKIYIDGSLVHTGTSWENYYRYDNEASAEQTPRTTDSLLFRASGAATPANDGKGFLFDNVELSSSTTPADTTPPNVPTHVSPADGVTLTTAMVGVIDWTDETDPSSPVTYIYQSATNSATNPDGSFVTPAYTSGPLATSEINAAGTSEGTYYWHVRSVDNEGNMSAWSSYWTIIVDNTPAPVCGDGNVDLGEQCDVGDTNNGDGCSSTCQNEAMACVPTDTDLVANWKLDESVGAATADDATANNNDGTVTGATSGGAGAPGLPFYNGGSYDFDGTDDSIDMGNNVGNFTVATPFTVSAWINPALDFSNNAIYGNAWANGGYLLRVNAENKVRFILVQNGSAGTVYNGIDSNVLSAGWHHVVGSWDGANVHVFVDGNEESITPITAGTVTDITSAANTFIGQTGEAGSEQYFDGEIDDVRVYSRALSLDEVDDLYAGDCEAVPVPTVVSCTTTDDNLVAHWDMDENAGTTVADASGEGNNAAVNGATWTGATATFAYDNLSALTFDGSNDFLSAANSASIAFDVNDTFSASAWVNPTAFSSYQTVISKLDDSNNQYRGYLFTLNNGTPELWLINDFGNNVYTVVPASEALTTGTWQQIGFSYDGTGGASGVHIYINGVDKTGASTQNTLASNGFQTSASFEMGLRSVVASQALNGSLDEVRVYNVELDSTHMAALAGGACDAGVTTPVVLPTDTDGDTIEDGIDNCPFTPNFDQANFDGDVDGDACDLDNDNDTINDNVDNCVFDANIDQIDTDTDGEGDVCDATPGSPAPTFFGGFSAPDTNDGENGSGRGERTNSLKGAANFITGVLGGSNNSIAPGAFGGGPNTPWSEDEMKVICSMRKALPQNAGSVIMQWLAGYVGQLMNRDADQVFEALKDPALCPAPVVHSKAKAAPVAFKVNAAGYPVSSNATWNKCLTGRVSLLDIRNNPDKDNDGLARDCSDYHTGNVWYHPDLHLFFTFDKKTHKVTVPSGYALTKQDAVSKM